MCKKTRMRLLHQMTISHFLSHNFTVSALLHQPLLHMASLKATPQQEPELATNLPHFNATVTALLVDIVCCCRRMPETLRCHRLAFAQLQRCHSPARRCLWHTDVTVSCLSARRWDADAVAVGAAEGRARRIFWRLCMWFLVLTVPLQCLDVSWRVRTDSKQNCQRAGG